MADQILARDVQTAIVVARVWLMQTTGGVPTALPHTLATAKLDECFQGFREMILTRILR